LIPLIVVVWLVVAVWRADYVPSLPVTQAERLIRQAPEFRNYARLIQVASVMQGNNSMKRRANGLFRFQYLKAPLDATEIVGDAEFGFWRGVWHLTAFRYGCPGDCHSVTVYNEPVDNSSLTLAWLRFMFFQPD
jgi:hypothetical protein